MNKIASILIADDDDDDCFLVQSALEECGITNPTIFVKDGRALLDYLKQNDATMVGLILLDLNMPCMDGREVLRSLKSDEKLRKIPVVILTTSRASQDIEECYAIGANCYVVKPASYSVFNDTIATLVKFWIELSQLPVIAAQSAKISF
ncbi:MAG: response regulator [Spirosomataceae bacterium]